MKKNKLPRGAKEIPDFPRYYATKSGDIWSGPKYGRPTYRKLNPGTGASGCLEVNLYVGKKRLHKKVHQLILKTFVGPRLRGLECRHLNGNPQDNRLNNLCWDTHANNMADTIKHKTSTRGEKNHHAKLNALQVRVIRHLLKFKTLKHREIAQIFGVVRQTISSINCGKAW